MTGSTENILLIVPPFQTCVRPALGVSQLKANLQEQGVPAKVLYLNFRFAERIGLDLYEWLSERTLGALLGEFIFSGVPRYREDQEIEKYINQILAESAEEDYLKQLFPDKTLLDVIRYLIQEASTFCHNEAMNEIFANNPWMVGFTSSFQQNCSSLALIGLIKQLKPDLLTAIGGANCQSEMGEELFKQFTNIDYVGQGECDHSFVNLVLSLRNGKNPVDIHGILSRRNNHPPITGDTLKSEDLDRLPYPDFEDYFVQLKCINSGDRILPCLVMETSRGCWWGAKQQCTFCGLNGDDIIFRSKTGSRALDEMSFLVNKYGVRQIMMADNSLDTKYFKTFFVELANHPIAKIFYEIKANLSKHQVRLLARSKVGWVQPGIESLSDHALQLMNKGTNKYHNIQLLKWCAESDIWVGWNYLYGFPGEKEDELAEIAPMIESLSHLQPPSKAGPIRIDRFSKYFKNPGMYGLEPVSPAETYKHIYPFPNDSLKRIAYFYQSGFFENVAESEAFKTINNIVEAWQDAYSCAYLLAFPRKKSLIIIDTRSCARRFWHRLSGIKRKVYEVCDKAQSFQQIINAVESSSESELESILDSFVNDRLMLQSGERYLSLAVEQGKNYGKVPNISFGGVLIPATQSKRLWKKLLLLVSLKIPPKKIITSLARRISITYRSTKRKALFLTISILAKFLSEDRMEDEVSFE